MYPARSGFSVVFRVKKPDDWMSFGDIPKCLQRAIPFFQCFSRASCLLYRPQQKMGNVLEGTVIKTRSMVLNKTRNIVANLCNFRLTRRSLILTIADIEDHIPILTCHGQTLISRHSVLLQNGHIHSSLLRATEASSTITLQPQAFIPFSNPTHCQRVILQEYLY